MSTSALSGRRRLLSRFALPFKKTFVGSCDEVRDALPGILDGEANAPSGLVEHVEYCLSCQAEVAGYRRLLRLLHQLRAFEVSVPPGVVSDVLSALEAAANRRAMRSLLTGRRLGYCGAVLAAAAVATVLVLVRPGRQRSAVAGPASA